MDRSSSDGDQSVDSGVVVGDPPSQHTQPQSDLSRLFRLENRTIVCRCALNALCVLVLTMFSDWWIRRTRDGSNTDSSAIGRGRGCH